MNEPEQNCPFNDLTWSERNYFIGCPHVTKPTIAIFQLILALCFMKGRRE